MALNNLNPNLSLPLRTSPKQFAMHSATSTMAIYLTPTLILTLTNFNPHPNLLTLTLTLTLKEAA